MCDGDEALTATLPISPSTSLATGSSGQFEGTTGVYSERIGEECWFWWWCLMVMKHLLGLFQRHLHWLYLHHHHLWCHQQVPIVNVLGMVMCDGDKRQFEPTGTTGAYSERIRDECWCWWWCVMVMVMCDGDGYGECMLMIMMVSLVMTSSWRSLLDCLVLVGIAFLRVLAMIFNELKWYVF